ncbi:MAG: MFS transporter [Hylemonella sp.]
MTASPAPEASGSERALFRLIGGHVFIHASMAGMRLASPLLILRESHSAMAVGMLLALFSLTQVFLALPAGRYADRHGIRRPIAFSVAGATAGALLAFLFPVFPVLCLSALLSGAATGTASIVLQRHVGRSARDATELKRFFGWLSLGPAFANFLGPFVTGLLIDSVGAWLGGQGIERPGFRAAFLLLAVFPLLSWYLVRNTHEHPKEEAQAGTDGRRIIDLLRVPMMRQLLIVNLLLAACWDVHTFVVPVLGHERGLSASAIGSLLGIFAIAAAVIRLLMPLVAAQLRERVVLSVAMLLTALVLLAYPFMPTAMGMGICSVLLGLALGSIQPMIMSALHQITPRDRHGEALGLRLMSINGSSVVMPMLFGLLGAAVGVSVVFWLVGASAALGARLAWDLRTEG